ncbi:ThuA domain-containing protein [Halalkalibaculum sp. DA384]|uniref:ThuA domain-containing protein n=1 Tax=Halalkalibaculum sp. DA384 TaxID=3373606 RepID=UPI00375483E4
MFIKGVNCGLKKIVLLGLALFLSTSTMMAQRGPDQDYQVLLFTKNLTFHHTSISTGVEMFKDLSEEGFFELTWTTIAKDWFNDIEDLSQFDVVVFMNTSGNVLNKTQKKIFQTYIRNGGNFVGIHGAAFTHMDDWDWYADLVGAWHNEAWGNSTAVVNVENPNHSSTAHLPSKWVVTEEWYNFRQISDDIKVLLTVDEDTYGDDRMGDWHPIAWYQEDFKGTGARSFYTVFGHPDGMYSNPWFQQHILGALWWAATGYGLDGSGTEIN